MEIIEFWKLYKNGVEKEVEGWFYDHDLITFWLIDLIQKEVGWCGDLCELGIYRENRLLPSAQWLGRIEALLLRRFP